MARSTMTDSGSSFAQRMLFWGATILPAGIAVAAIFSAPLGSVLTVAALTTLIAGVHLFGRAGPDPGA
jgi:hypothetical protein